MGEVGPALEVCFVYPEGSTTFGNLDTSSKATPCFIV